MIDPLEVAVANDGILNDHILSQKATSLPSSLIPNFEYLSSTFLRPRNIDELYINSGERSNRLDE